MYSQIFGVRGYNGLFDKSYIKIDIVQRAIFIEGIQKTMTFAFLKDEYDESLGVQADNYYCRYISVVVPHTFKSLYLIYYNMS